MSEQADSNSWQRLLPNRVLKRRIRAAAIKRVRKDLILHSKSEHDLTKEELEYLVPGRKFLRMRGDDATSESDTGAKLGGGRLEQIDSDARNVLVALQKQQLTPDEIIAATKLPSPVVATALLNLELKKMAVRGFNGRYEAKIQVCG